jgi:hypothetical protein
MSESNRGEGKLSFEVFRAGFRAQLQGALSHPISKSEFIFSMLVMSSKPKEIAQNAEYLQGVVRLYYADLALLDRDQLEMLKVDFVNQITQAVPESQFNYDIWRHLFRESPANVIQHEMEHIEVLPQSLRDKAIIDLVLYEDGGKFKVTGVSWFDYSNLTDKEWAISSSNPQSLGDEDIRRARESARKTKDHVFIAEIEQKIKARWHHEFE